MAANVELDLIPVTDLIGRYGIQRSNVYNRLSKLSQMGFEMTPEQQGGKAYLNADQLAVMDQLDQHIKAGGAIAEFCPTGQLNLSHRTQDNSTLDSRPMGQSELTYETQDISSELEQLEMMERFAGLVEAISAKLTPKTEPLANLEALEKASTHGWLVSTSQLAPLLGLRRLVGQQIERYGFICTRVGRNGTESAWKIEKLSA